MTSNRRGLLILGTHVFAEEVADIAQDSGEHVVAGFVENWDESRCEEQLLGLPIHWIDDLAELSAGHVGVCAIGTTQRRAFIEQAQGLGLEFTTLRHRNTSISATAELGHGSIASAGVVVATATRIGAHVILNRGVLIGHHTTVGDFVTISPGANVAGCVTIGDGAYIGMGATVLDRMHIGEGALVGAGAVVTRDVESGTQVMGVPARVVKTGVSGR